MALHQRFNMQGKTATLAWPIGTVMADLFDKLGWVNRVLELVAYLVVAVAVASILASLYNTMNERRREFAILRALGASRTTVFSAIVAEAGTIAALGAAAGLFVYAGVLAAAAWIVRTRTGVVIEILHPHPALWMAPVSMALLGALAGVLPALKAYRADRHLERRQLGRLHDVVLLSGGTSKGSGDVAARVVGRLSDPGVVVHGVALKPGKPLCLAVSGGKPVVILPGFPTSAIFTFHEFVAPVLRAFAGLPPERRETVSAVLATRVASQRGRTEYVMVSLVERPGGGLGAYPTGKGSGAVTAFGQADGFFAVKAQAESVAAGTPVEVTLIGGRHRPADLVVMGSHCVGLDVLVGRLTREGLSVKAVSVGSLGGLAAARRGECDVAGVHLMDPESGAYNRPFLTEALELVTGYRREQGIVFRPGDARFEGRSAEAAVAMALGSRPTGRCLRGSCGGPEALGPDGEPPACANCPNRAR